mmetsp:Transcript_14330/g.41170  ORF Transcript_14330/g.41170 Transcript_14330/m.41170 type:complete len:391 (-) Transcript_14330:379-1551(-)
MHVLHELVLLLPVGVVPARVVEHSQRHTRDESSGALGRHRGHELVVEEATLPMRAEHHARGGILVLELSPLKVRAVEVLAGLLDDCWQGHLHDAMRLLEFPACNEARPLLQGVGADRAATLREAPLIEFVRDLGGQIDIRLALASAPVGHHVGTVVAVEADLACDLGALARHQWIARGAIAEVGKQAGAEAQDVCHLVHCGAQLVRQLVGLGRQLRPAEVDEAENGAVALVHVASGCVRLQALAGFTCLRLNRSHKEEQIHVGSATAPNGWRAIAHAIGSAVRTVLRDLEHSGIPCIRRAIGHARLGKRHLAAIVSLLLEPLCMGACACTILNAATCASHSRRASLRTHVNRLKIFCRHLHLGPAHELVIRLSVDSVLANGTPQGSGMHL